MEEDGDGGGGESASEEEWDDSLDEDMQALKRACLVAGIEPTAELGDYSSDSEDDLDLLRSIQKRFPLPITETVSKTVIETVSVTKESEEEDEFEILRAIQKRFRQYEKDSVNVGSRTPDDKTSRNHPEGGTGESFSVALDKLENLRPSEERPDGSLQPAYKPSKFPLSAQKFVDALKLNRSCQKFIRAKLIEIEAKVERVKELKKRTKCLMDLQGVPRRKMGKILCQRKDPRVRLIALPKERALSKLIQRGPLPLCYGPAENPHVSAYRKVLAAFPHLSSKPQWSKSEKENLAKGIKQQYQEKALLASMEISDDPGQTLEGPLGFFQNKLRSANDITLMVDWDRLSSMYLPSRSGAECESRWLNHEDPVINHDPWMPQEEKKLLHIIQTNGIYNWIDISISLGTHRTPFQCLVRYQRSLNPCILKKDWTEDEDSRLRAAVDVFGDKNWQLVASYLQGRTGNQCSNRWRKSLHPGRRKVGRWSVDEDKRLKVAVMLFGAKNWNKIAQFIPGRTQVQCRERWVNCLDPALKLEEWSIEEDTKLREAIATYGYCWSKVASSLSPRTDNQCMRRWKTLFPDEVFQRQAIRKVQKAVLITNFVDRELERPLISPSDFCINLNSDALPITNGRKRKRDAPKHVSSRKRKPQKETTNDIVNESLPIENHGHEFASKKRKRRLDHVLEPQGIKRKGQRCSRTTCLELSPLSPNIPKKIICGRSKAINNPLNLESDASEQVISPKRTTTKEATEDISNGAHQIENHGKEIVLYEREETIDLFTESEASKNSSSEMAPLSLDVPLKSYVWRKKNVDTRLKAESNTSERVAPKKGKTRNVPLKNISDGSHQIESQSQNNVSTKREKTLAEIIESERIKIKERRHSRTSFSGLVPQLLDGPKKDSKRRKSVNGLIKDETSAVISAGEISKKSSKQARTKRKKK